MVSGFLGYFTFNSGIRIALVPDFSRSSDKMISSVVSRYFHVLDLFEVDAPLAHQAPKSDCYSLAVAQCYCIPRLPVNDQLVRIDVDPSWLEASIWLRSLRSCLPCFAGLILALLHAAIAQ